MGRIRVLVVDDHRIFAEALATALAAEPDVEVSAAGSAPAAERALERGAAEGRAFDVVLVDADLGRAPAPRSGHPLAARSGPPGGPPGPGGSGNGPVRPGGAGAVPLAAPQRRALLPAGAAQPGGAIARLGPVVPAPAAPRPPAGGGAPPAGGLRVPAGDGIALVARVRAAHPGLRAVVLAADDDPRRAVRALQAGAGGWVAKESSLGRLLAVVRGVLRDETHVPAALLTGVIRELTAARRDRTESERLVESLTPREKQVLRCMVAGMGRQAVADRLYLSPHTVRTHMQNVLGKLGVHSTLAAVALARRAGVRPADAG